MKRKNFLTLAVMLFTLIFSATTFAGIVTDRFPITCYSDKKIYTYDSPNGNRKGYIDANVDWIKITEARNGWFKCTYNGLKNPQYNARWIRMEDICADVGYSNRGVKVRGNQNVYITASNNTRLGSVSNNEDVIVLADNGSRAQILYRLDNGTGFKMGWIASSSVVSQSSNRTVPTNPVNPMIQPVSRTHDPEGYIDSIVSNGANQISVRGWAFDRDDLSASLEIHVYIGGPPGSGAEFHNIPANKRRDDLNSHNLYRGVGTNHGFEDTINVKRTGNQIVYICAFNIGGGKHIELGHRNVYIQPTPNENWDSKVGQRIDTNSSEYLSPVNKFSQGQCTWYAWGRMKQVTGKSITFSGSSTAKLWKDNASNCSQVELQSHCIAVRIHGGWNKAHTYENGHVAFVEHVEGNNVYYSESNWSVSTDKTIKKTTIANFKNLYAYFIK